MQSKYHGYSLGADTFFANSEVDALEEFGNMAGCEVRKCVYPVRGERVYCISTSGQLFGLIRDKSKHGCTVGTVHITVQRVIANLREAFLKDFKVLGIEPQKGEHRNLFI